MVLWDDLGFATNYEVDANPEYPGDGVWGMPQYELRDEVSRTALAVISPQSGEPWLLNATISGYADVVATPDPNVLCVTERVEHPVFIDVRDPNQRRSAEFTSIRIAAALDEQLLLFVGFYEVMAWGADGVEWRSGMIANDEVQILRTDNGRILCRCDVADVPGGREVVLDAATGRRID